MRPGWDATPRKATLAAQNAPRTPIMHVRSSGLNTQSPAFRRSAAFSSPQVHAQTPPPSAVPTQPPRRSWRPRISLDTTALLSYAQSLQMSVEELLQQPELGVPIAVGLHAASLAAQVMLPGSPFSVPLVSSSYVPPSQRRGQSRLFATRPRADHSYGAVLGRTLAMQRSAALRGMAIAVLVILVLVSLLNAYMLFSRRRTYRLWYHDEKKTLNNPHARLEDPPQDASKTRTWREFWIAVLLAIARQVPVLEWFVPPAPVKPAAKERLYSLRVWDIHEVQVTIFTCVSANMTVLPSACALVGHCGHAWPERIWRVGPHAGAHGCVLMPDTVPLE